MHCRAQRSPLTAIAFPLEEEKKKWHQKPHPPVSERPHCHGLRGVHQKSPESPGKDTR